MVWVVWDEEKYCCDCVGVLCLDYIGFFEFNFCIVIIKVIEYVQEL